MSAKGPIQRTRAHLQECKEVATFEGNADSRYVLVVMDYFNKWSEVYPISYIEKSG